MGFTLEIWACTNLEELWKKWKTEDQRQSLPTVLDKTVTPKDIHTLLPRILPYMAMRSL